jgi:hypothetical protein
VLSGRRTLTLLLVLAAIGLPAVVLQAACVGRSCEDEASAPARVPFCPLPEAVKTAISNGYREGRSPDVLGVTASRPLATEVGGVPVAWPATGNDARVPIVFWGAGITPRPALASGVTLDRIAPSLAEVLAFERPFPEVRSGAPIDDVASGDGADVRLVLLIAWKGVGTADLESAPSRWNHLATLVDEGAGTLEADAGSLPLDPAATLATIGTGGLPSQHGITGSSVRDARGDVVPPFASGDPFVDGQVISTLADDLGDADPRTRVGLVAADPTDIGLVGGGWYPDQDAVEVPDDADPVAGVEELLERGFGANGVTDVIGVALAGELEQLDRATRDVVDAAEAATDGAVTVAVAGTGAPAPEASLEDGAPIAAVEAAVPGADAAVAAVVPGGIFLDQATLTQAAVTGQVAVDALLGVTDGPGRRMMADAFQGFAVSFARYC